MGGMKMFEVFLDRKGSAKSGNWGHAGRPGKRGGSAPKAKMGLGMVLGGDDLKRAERMTNKIEMDLNDSMGEPDPRNYPDDPTMQDEYESEAYYWEMADELQQGNVKDMAVSGVAEKSGESYKTCNDTVRQWSYSSNDDDMRSLALQRDASKEFGVPMSDFTKSKIKAVESDKHQRVNKGQAIWSQHLELNDSKTQRKVLRGMYDNTQERLRSKGIGPDDNVTLYRGVRLPKDPNLIPGMPRRLEGNSIESWSINEYTAATFARGFDDNTTGVVLQTSVPARNILSIPTTGFGCLTEGEVVLLGTDGVGMIMDVMN